MAGAFVTRSGEVEEALVKRRKSGVEVCDQALRGPLLLRNSGRQPVKRGSSAGQPLPEQFGSIDARPADAGLALRNQRRYRGGLSVDTAPDFGQGFRRTGQQGVDDCPCFGTRFGYAQCSSGSRALDVRKVGKQPLGRCVNK